MAIVRKSDDIHTIQNEDVIEKAVVG